MSLKNMLLRPETVLLAGSIVNTMLGRRVSGRLEDIYNDQTLSLNRYQQEVLGQIVQSAEDRFQEQEDRLLSLQGAFQSGANQKTNVASSTGASLTGQKGQAQAAGLASQVSANVSKRTAARNKDTSVIAARHVNRSRNADIKRNTVVKIATGANRERSKQQEYEQQAGYAGQLSPWESAFAGAGYLGKTWAAGQLLKNRKK